MEGVFSWLAVEDGLLSIWRQGDHVWCLVKADMSVHVFCLFGDNKGGIGHLTCGIGGGAHLCDMASDEARLPVPALERKMAVSKKKRGTRVRCCEMMLGCLSEAVPSGMIIASMLALWKLPLAGTA
jgi:hypothetical protein